MTDRILTMYEYQLPQSPIRKTRVLIISDSPDRLTRLRGALNAGEVEITSVSSPQELGRACREEHDLAIIDVQPVHIRGVLKSQGQHGTRRDFIAGRSEQGRRRA